MDGHVHAQGGLGIVPGVGHAGAVQLELAPVIGEGGHVLQDVHRVALEVDVVGVLLDLPHNGADLRPGDAVQGLEDQLARLVGAAGEHAVFVQDGDVAVVHVGKGRGLGRRGKAHGLGGQLGHQLAGDLPVQVLELVLLQPVFLHGVGPIGRGVVRPLLRLHGTAARGLQHHDQGRAQGSLLVGAKGAVFIAGDNALGAEGGHIGVEPVVLRHVGKGRVIVRRHLWLADGECRLAKQ